MKSFLTFINEEKNPIPVGKYDSDERMNIDHFVRKIETSRPKVTKFNPSIMISAGMLFATQHEINNRAGFDDPVFPKYDDKPVLINYKDDIYIVDGHHRMARAYKTNTSIEVYMFTY